MEQVIDRASVKAIEFNPLTQMADALHTLTAGNKLITWTAQPAEQAIYLHATGTEQFQTILAALNTTITDLNEVMKNSDQTGRYYCTPDPDRHCIDLYYSQL